MINTESATESSTCGKSTAWQDLQKESQKPGLKYF